MQPYLGGAIIGYIMFQLKSQTYTKSNAIIVLYWVAAVPIFIASLFVTYFKETSSTAFAFVSSFGRFFLALFVGSLVIVCHLGHGGIINRCLSHRIFTHLNRLTYFIYLLNPFVITLIRATQDSSAHFDISSMVSIMFKIIMKKLVSGCHFVYRTILFYSKKKVFIN